MNKLLNPHRTFAQRVTEILTRLNLTEQGGANYLGVPVYTLRKWINGTREPSAAVIRLLDVLELVETQAPELHRTLVQVEK